MAPSTTKRVCNKCGRVGTLKDDFPWASRKPKGKPAERYQLHYCRECERKHRRRYRKKNQKRRREIEGNWRKRHPDRKKKTDHRYNTSERGRDRRRRYEKTDKGKATQTRWRQSPKGKKYQRRQNKRRKEKLKALSANIPIPVLRPFIEPMVKSAGSPKELADRIGVPEESIYNIIRTDKKLKQVKLEVADRIALHADFTLEELYERAEEWAFLTGDRWPRGYYLK